MAIVLDGTSGITAQAIDLVTPLVVADGGTGGTVGGVGPIQPITASVASSALTVNGTDTFDAGSINIMYE